MKNRFLLFTLLIAIIFSIQVYASAFRVAQLPNGSKFGCANCHVSPGGGGPRNSFGTLVERNYLNQQGDVVWGAALANEDPDGDGVKNGLELQDPNGTWKAGQSDPGNFSLVTNPGDRNSKPTSVEDLKMPTTYSLEQNYPNPFNPETVISYKLQATSHVTLKVYDVIGNEVATLVDEEKQAGVYNYQLSIINSSPRSTRVGAGKLSSGVFFYRLTANGFSETKKMILLK